MLTRYFRDEKGHPAIKAEIYEKSDHPIDRSAIDADAVKICARLVRKGFEAYVVGGAVRDLLLGLVPKDFDIATSASPSQVRQLFRNSRVIGKRFRLVHVYFADGKILEVATFRSPESGNRKHVYGTLPEDVMRRDFSLNALYYDPQNQTIIDFVNGVRDIRKKQLRSVLPLESSFVEDPVRMLRAVKYAAITGMKIPMHLGMKIKKQAPLLGTASVSRLSEELYKILKSRHCEPVIVMMEHYRLLRYMLPHIQESLRTHAGEVRQAFLERLRQLDALVEQKEIPRGVMLEYFCRDLLEASGALREQDGAPPEFEEVVQRAKDLIKPLIQPNHDMEMAVRQIFADKGWKSPRRRHRRPEERRRNVAVRGDGRRKHHSRTRRS